MFKDFKIVVFCAATTVCAVQASHIVAVADDVAQIEADPRIIQQLVRAVGEPPLLGSDITNAELEFIKAQILTLAARDIAQITCEVSVSCFRFGDRTIKDYATQETPMTALLLRLSLDLVEPYIAAVKSHFGRQRPSVADSVIVPAIQVPPHSAYPSGHAVQAYLLAEILSLLRPAESDQYIEDASQIAANRVRAGLHYPSDSKAGVVMARLYLKLLLRENWFAVLVAKSSREWDDGGAWRSRVSAGSARLP